MLDIKIWKKGWLMLCILSKNFPKNTIVSSWCFLVDWENQKKEKQLKINPSHCSFSSNQVLCPSGKKNCKIIYIIGDSYTIKKIMLFIKNCLHNNCTLYTKEKGICRKLSVQNLCFLNTTWEEKKKICGPI